MAANHKLTAVIKGRTITAAHSSDGSLDLTFGDNSQMRIKTAAGCALPTDQLINKTIEKVRQSGTRMELDFTDQSSAEISLAEATSSVMLRDKANQLEYAD